MCSIGASCGNRLTPRCHLDLITSRVGQGVVATSPILNWAFSVEYVGEMLVEEDALDRSDSRYQVHMKDKALWDGPSEVFIDAAQCGNERRFINHCCSPNCALYECEWANSARLGVFANMDIPALQELTRHYR
ncbi:hypothetical protein PI124_g17758 [Phytophthora idaei]|nr:hypothetical protein PI125_g16369 [Phytophthora idaei]KAG3135762.1 hypothetical protein PI126_g18105 [Phytophthora idaei]KAG3237250.1 hypothetical protein PI124_g17758 [Phytophthora idaei]